LKSWSLAKSLELEVLDFGRYLAMHPNVTVKLTKLIGLRLKKIQSRVENLVSRDTGTFGPSPFRIKQDRWRRRRTGDSPQGQVDPSRYCKPDWL